MKKILAITLLFALIFLSACGKKPINLVQPKTTEAGETCSLNSTGTSDCNTDTQKPFSITSTAFTSGDKIPLKYSCAGENVNPPLEISNPPKGTQSFALIVHDPDASAGDWIHRIIWNFNVNTTKIEEGKTPISAAIGKNSRGKSEYRGPCPPSGTHRYFFKLYALDTNYGDLPGSMTLSQFESNTQLHILGTTEIMGTYSSK